MRVTPNLRLIFKSDGQDREIAPIQLDDLQRIQWSKITVLRHV
jgi:hypothetical protein